MKMIDKNNMSSYEHLTLKHIASWQVSGLETDSSSSIIAKVPSLQRGAVWEPQQIEMLWDSIMRGFPIGAIVIAKKIKNQKDQSSPTSEGTQVTQETTHHILDGQQRCNAIAWGYVNPWKENHSDDIVLWLDLQPGNRIKNTTRKYLFRVTTKAHPWGFDHGDDARNLIVSDIQKFKEKLESLHDLNNWSEEYHDQLISKQDFDQGRITRPSPKYAMPYDAGFPVPVFLLFEYFKEGKLDWELFLKDERLKKIIAWSGTSLDLKHQHIQHIETGLLIASQGVMVVQQVPDLIEGINDIEQIFQRLNRQGTRLDNEELVYSLIKAYWPEVESKVRDLPKHTTEARLVGLGIRVALTESNSEKLFSELSVERIRKIFSPSEKTIEDQKARQLIKAFFEEGGLSNTLKWIDDQFLYTNQIRDYGIPKYLRSSLAWHSREVFGWLMLLANRYEFNDIEDKLIKKIIGLALTIHWFDVHKVKAVDILIKHHHDFETFTIGDFNVANERPTVHIPLQPEKIDLVLQIGGHSRENQLSTWKNFWEGVVNIKVDGTRYAETEAKERADQFGYFIGKLQNERELLVYAQRAYIETVFEGFDPSNKLMWKGHNRPWDYDHILPSETLNGQGKGLMKKYLKFVQAWQQSIGNLVAVDFSFNRSAKDSLNPCEKYGEIENNKHDSNCMKILTKNLSEFNLTLEDADDFERSKRFALAVKDRLINLYTEWYSQLEIGEFLTRP